MICPKCGAKLEEGTRVCPICGKSLVATSVGTVFKRRDYRSMMSCHQMSTMIVIIRMMVLTRRNSMMILISMMSTMMVLTRKNSMMMDMRRKVVHMIMKIMKPIFQTNQMRSR